MRYEVLVNLSVASSKNLFWAVDAANIPDIFLLNF
jgi:hypothetical protein